MAKVVRATCEAMPNIALVKYWGKRDEQLLLPVEGSISVTMDETLQTRTTVAFSDAFEKDEATVNGRKIEGKALEETLKQVNVIRQKTGEKRRVMIVSLNCFPTGAGMASSASGFAALAVATAQALGLKMSPGELSVLARLGSGSACRSVLGGFVEWLKGEKSDGSDSYAVQLAKPSHWPELKNVIAIVEKKEKKVPSRAGMKQTVATSGLFKERLRMLPKRLEAVRAAIRGKDFETLMEETMKESSNMHAVMLDTWPPITYLNDVSRDIMHSVIDLNANGVKAGYTFDAGPNAHVFTLEKNVNEVKKLLQEIRGVEKILVCGVGNGPRLLNEEKDALIDQDGKAKAHRFDEKSGKIVVG